MLKRMRKISDFLCKSQKFWVSLQHFLCNSSQVRYTKYISFWREQKTLNLIRSFKKFFARTQTDEWWSEYAKIIYARALRKSSHYFCIWIPLKGPFFHPRSLFTQKRFWARQSERKLAPDNYGKAINPHFAQYFCAFPG